MARLDQLPKGTMTPLRLVLILIFLLSLTGFVVYFFAVPLRMLYWGGTVPLCVRVFTGKPVPLAGWMDA